MAEHQWTPEELQGLSALGLSITPHSDPVHGWGYIWQGRDWAGPFTTPAAAIHAAFTEAMQALQFRSDYSWVLSAEPPLTRRQMADREERQSKRRMLRVGIGCAVALFVFALIVFAYFFAK